MKLLGDRVLVQPIPSPPPATESGIQIPESHWYTADVMGTVVALGTGPVAEDGTRLPHTVKVGDKVIFPAEAGHEVWIDFMPFILLRELDLQAVFV